jgi:ADP-ribose pyrophosphatase
MQSWKTITRDTILERPPFLVVENHKVELPDGKIIPDWAWVIAPDYVNVVAITDRKTFLCFRQTKYGIDGTSLATIGGYIEPNESPLEAAQRELREETGYESFDWINLGQYRVDANRGMGSAHFFLARQAHKVAEPNTDDLEEQHLLQLHRPEIEAALINGEFKVISWAASIALALLYIQKEE